MSEQDAPAPAPASVEAPVAALVAAPVTADKPEQVPETVTVDVVAAEAAATTKAADVSTPKADEASTPQKRRLSSPRVAKKPDDPEHKPADGEDTESEPEKQPKKRAKTTKGPKKTPGRKKKVVEVELNPQEEQKHVEAKVNALSDEIKGRFGQIVWAKMGGYPYWPCIITDPRLLPQKLQETAMKALETKYLVFFYVSNNFATISFKMIEPWDDTKFKYREGHPEKDSKAPKRRVKLMSAIEVADRETKLPIQERADGLLKPLELVVVKLEELAPAPVKRKPGRPPKAKNAVKTPPKKTVKKHTDGAASVQEEEEVVGPMLSKEEIKAKVASRKTPKKKGADEASNASGAAVKKALKALAKHKVNGSAEIDSKRKKEIELVVPHKSVKSADIREMTEEAAKKKLNGPKSKTKKDKGEYKVGDLASYASRMTRLHAKESARNNDELVSMMQALFKETLMYRSDVERSGLAAIIAVLRKKSNPTVGQTASALRKHMINILNHDTEIVNLGKKGHEDDAGHGSKKRKVENGSSVKAEDHLLKEISSAENSDAKGSSPVKAEVSSPAANAPTTTKVEDPSNAVIKTENVMTPSEPVEVTAVKAVPMEDVVVKAETVDEKTDAATEKRSASPTDSEKPTDGVVKDKEDLFAAPEHQNKNRTIFVDMLSKILDHDGAKRADLAKDIEGALYERFKDNSDEYLTQARIIIFGLKENASKRERLFSGALHSLELAYSDDAFFKATE